MVAKIRKLKKDYWAIFFSILIGLFLLSLIGFLIISNLRIGQKRREMISQIESLKKEIQLLEEKNAQLRAGINQAESETYWEEKAREQGYKKPGETQIVILPPEGRNQTTSEKEENFWQKIFDWFKRD